MNYFYDVYLKRVNKYGDNIQDRIHGKLEADFENKLEKSVNRVDIYDSSTARRPSGVGIFVEKGVKQEKFTNFLLTRVKDQYTTGKVFWTDKPHSKGRDCWIIVLKEEYQTIGYNRYQIVKLDRTISWLGTDGLLYSSPVHYMGNIDGGYTNNGIRELFKIKYDNVHFEPSRIMQMIAPYSEKLTRSTRFNLNDSTWKVAGYDKESVPGVMYLIIDEDYTYESDFANISRLDKWSIISAQGKGITLTKEESIDFYCSYDGILTSEKVNVTSNDSSIKVTEKNDKFYFSGEPKTFSITVSLKNNKEVSQNFDVTLTEEETDWMVVRGPDKLKVLQTLQYEVSGSLAAQEFTVSSENGCFLVDRIEGNKVYLTGNNIGKDNIILVCGDNSYKMPIEIIGPWM